MDVDWTAEFATAKWILPWTGANAAAVSQGVLPGPLQTATWKGKLYAAPINSNTQLLWYRKDLVPNPPKTWTQMIDDAIALAKQGKPHYIEEQGAKYEGLTVWFNSLVDSAAGGILTKDNKVDRRSIDQDRRRDHASSGQLAGRRPGTQRGSGRTVRNRLGARNRRVPDQLSLRLVGGPSRQPGDLQAMGYAAVPQRHAGHGAQGLDRRLQPRRLVVLASPPACVRRRQVPRPAKNQVRTRSRGAGPGRPSIYDDARVREGLSLPRLIKAQLAGLRDPAPDRGLRRHHARHPERAVADVQHGSEHDREHLAQRDQGVAGLGGAAVSTALSRTGSARYFSRGAGT